MSSSPSVEFLSVVATKRALEKATGFPDTARCLRHATRTPPDLCLASPVAAEARKAYPAFLMLIRKLSACTSDCLVSCRKITSSVAPCKYFLHAVQEVTLAVTRLTVPLWPPPFLLLALGAGPSRSEVRALRLALWRADLLLLVCCLSSLGCWRNYLAIATSSFAA